jgi:hypothetical protein
MYQHFKGVNRSWASIAREVISLMLWVTQRMLWMLFSRPMINVLALLLVLWLITGFLRTLVAPQPGAYPQPAAIFVGR